MPSSAAYSPRAPSETCACGDGISSRPPDDDARLRLDIDVGEPLDPGAIRTGLTNNVVPTDVPNTLGELFESGRMFVAEDF
jgi:hypothetical protein